MNFEVGLFYGHPDHGGIEVPSGFTGYQRQPVTFAQGEDRIWRNSTDVTFPFAADFWGEITYFGLFDTSVFPAFVGQLVSRIKVEKDTQLVFPIGYLSLKLEDEEEMSEQSVDWAAHRIVDLLIDIKALLVSGKHTEECNCAACKRCDKIEDTTKYKAMWGLEL